MTDDRPGLGEESIIQEYFAPLAQGFPGALGLKDDCALIAPEPGTELVLKTDPIAEGVHFLSDDAPEDIAWKALTVNVSDLAAKAATPIGYLMALSFPATPARTWLSRFATGLRAAQDKFECHLIGGDTDKRPGPISVSITLVGAVERGRMVRRGTANPGDVLFVSGTLGDAALGLALRKETALAKRWGLTPDEAQHLVRRYLRPEPRLALADTLRQYASAAMDLSDGLAKDLGRMCAASTCAGRVRFSDLPLSVAGAKALSSDANLIESIVAGGDDYEVLAAVPEKSAADFTASASRAQIAVTAIGALEPGAGIVIEPSSGEPLELPATGWDHF